METIAVVHHKGGVGKTTTTAHLGRALSQLDSAPRVLLVDLDPQASLTRLVGLDAPDARTDVGYVAAIEDRDISAHVVRAEQWGVDVLPAGARHARIERSTQPGIEQQLRLLLAEPLWDFVLIDAPGSMGVLTTTALTAAAGGVIVPTTPDYLAMEPLKVILEMVSTIREVYQPGCRLRGIVINAQAHTVEHQHQAEKLRATFGDRVLGTIPRRAAIQDAASSGTPLSMTRTGPAAALREDYRAMAAQLAMPVGVAS